jgi:hypothetical protein
VILSGRVCRRAGGGTIRPVTRRPLLAALPLLLVLGGCSGDDAEDDLPAAQVGEVIAAQLSSQVEGHHTYVVLPGRRYDFTVSSPQEEIDSFSAADAGVSAKAGEGRRFVEVAWELNTVPGDTFVMQAPEDVEPMLTLTADGEQHPIGPLVSEGGNAAIVVVPEEADGIGLEIEYDRLTQVIEDAYDPVVTRADGPDSLYLDAPTQRWETCPETSLSGGDPAVSFYGADCKANISSPVPYFGPLGWARPGREWVVVRFLAGAPLTGYDAPSGYVEYTVRESRVRLRLEGADTPELFPLEEGQAVGPQEDGSWQALAVFSVLEGTDGTLTFSRPLTALPNDPAQAGAAGAPKQIHRLHSGSL